MKYYIKYSSWFDTHKYDIGLMSDAIIAAGAFDLKIETIEPNRPKVLTFRYYGWLFRPTEPIEDALIANGIKWPIIDTWAFPSSTEAYKEIICKVNCERGAPMGRPGQGSKELTTKNGKLKYNKGFRVFRRRVPLDSGGYDKGGAYWGIGGPLYVEYTATLEYVSFERCNNSFQIIKP